MILSPASKKWRGAYYACRICKQNADFICPRGLTPICINCKTRYIGIFGSKAFEIIIEERKKKSRKRKWQHQNDRVAKYKDLQFF